MSEADDGGEGEPLPQDLLEQADENFQGRKMGGMTLMGRVGFHTLYSDDGGPEMAFQTALHMALSDLLEELWVDEDAVERHGEPVEEAMAAETVEQMHELTGVRLDPWSREQFEDNLAEYLRKLPQEVPADD